MATITSSIRLPKVVAAPSVNVQLEKQLAIKLQNGNGVKKDYRSALNHWRTAAGAGDAIAQHAAGCFLEFGVGVPRNLKQAARWYRMAAIQNNVAGQYSLGVCYAEGVGVPKNIRLAKKWITAAAQQGDRDARKVLRQLEICQ